MSAAQAPPGKKGAGASRGSASHLITEIPDPDKDPSNTIVGAGSDNGQRHTLAGLR